MTDARVDLREVGELNRRVRVAEADALFRQIVASCSLEELGALEAELEQTLQGFLPKRRRLLVAVLEARRRATTLQASEDRPSGGHAVADQPEGANTSLPARQSHDPAPVPVAVTQDEIDAGDISVLAIRADENWRGSATEIAELNRRAKPAEAEERLLNVLEDMDPAQVRAREVEIRSLLGDFFPKRRRKLLQALDDALAVPLVAPEQQRLAPMESQDAAPVGAALRPTVSVMRAPITPKTPAASDTQETAPDLSYVANRLHADLEDLSEHHIFQWATFYRDTLAQYFQDFLEEMVLGGHEKALLKIARSAFSRHAREVFEKGYHYTINQPGNDSHYAITKSLSGLQRFLDLPLEFYSARLSDASNTGTATQLRRLCSAMTLGIVGGYASSTFDQAGSAVLPRFSRSWAHILPFLTVTDLRELISVLEPGVFSDGVGDSLIPLASAIDSLVHERPELAPLPALAQFHHHSRRIDLSLHLPPTVSDSRLLEVHCYLSPDYVERHDLEEAAARAVALVVAPLKSDLRALVSSVDRFNAIVVPIGGPGREHDSARVQAVLEESVWASRSETGSVRPITFNYASDFPVDNPFLTKYNHVYRSSVRRLMQSYERRNGVRLWCSVRRSGKTTACSSDLGATSGHSTVIAQTCDSTGQMPDGDVFYRRVRHALSTDEELADDFVMRAISECAPQRSLRDGRILFVLDEYETLFGRLRETLKVDPGKRYSIVQPLLNQFVAFTQENLLVFMGQQPNAHFILMDQNQLSPVVEQDSFPLFSHSPNQAHVSEFDELLGKIMTSHVDLNTEFVNAVFSETGGHPFLTVKLMVSFMDWLIHSQKPVSVLAPAQPEIFEQFKRERLSYALIARDSHLEFFKAAATSALSQEDRQSNPWLHSAYMVLRALALDSPDTLTFSMSDFERAANRYCVNITGSELLATASKANFLAFDDSHVRARIPLLARIAGAVTPR